MFNFQGGFDHLFGVLEGQIMKVGIKYSIPFHIGSRTKQSMLFHKQFSES